MKPSHPNEPAPATARNAVRAAIIVCAAAALCAALIALDVRAGGNRAAGAAAAPGRHSAAAASRTPASSAPAASAAAPPVQSPTAVPADRPAPAAVPPSAETKAPVPALIEAFEREPRDATSAEAEQRIRSFFESTPSGPQIFRGVRCTRSVCRADLRWSPELSRDYNEGLSLTMLAFGRDISLDPDLGADGPQMPVPMAFYVARPGHSVQTILADQAQLAQQAR